MEVSIMAIIKCSECGKEISDKAKVCPNCGCPNDNIYEIHYEKFASYVCDNCGEGLYIPDTDIRDKYVCPKCNSPVWYLMSSIVDTNTGKEIDTYFDESRNVGYRALEPHSRSSITCPYCQSTNTKKLGVIGRSVSFGLFGFGSSKVGKQWHCNSCDSDF